MKPTKDLLVMLLCIVCSVVTTGLIGDRFIELEGWRQELADIVVDGIGGGLGVWIYFTLFRKKPLENENLKDLAE